MYATLLYTVGFSFLIALTATFGLHLLGRLLFLSSHRRTRKLFADTPWLPLRSVTGTLPGENVEFQSSGKVTLRGTFLSHRGAHRKGTVLFCHELNGTRESVAPYADHLLQAGFDILAFDLRNHGKSDFQRHALPTPWVTTADMDDIRAAVDYLESRGGTEPGELGIFGFGKGATLALCAAGSDSRIRSVVLDAPVKETKLFSKNCRDILRKSMKLSRRRTSRFFTLFSKALLYTVACPVLSIAEAWHRFMLGIWFGCRFVNPWAFAKKVHQPMLIVHGHIDSAVRPDHVQALCNRMADRPKLWLIPEKNRSHDGTVHETCSRQVTRFFEEALHTL